MCMRESSVVDEEVILVPQIVPVLVKLVWFLATKSEAEKNTGEKNGKPLPRLLQI